MEIVIPINSCTHLRKQLLNELGSHDTTRPRLALFLRHVVPNSNVEIRKVSIRLLVGVLRVDHPRQQPRQLGGRGVDHANVRRRVHLGQLLQVR